MFFGKRLDGKEKKEEKKKISIIENKHGNKRMRSKIPHRTHSYTTQNNERDAMINANVPLNVAHFHPILGHIVYYFTHKTIDKHFPTTITKYGNKIF